MEKKNRILNYSFAQIDILKYKEKFFAEREERIRCLFPLNKEEIYGRNSDPDLFFAGLKAEYCSDTLLEPEFGNEFQTFSFLKWVLQNCLVDGLITERDTVILNKLQKKFEVFNRMYASYNFEIRKTSENYTDTENYALLSLILNMRFMNGNNFNDFNTVLKLNDLLLMSGWQIKSEYPNLIISCFQLENIVMRKFYEL